MTRVDERVKKPNEDEQNGDRHPLPVGVRVRARNMLPRLAGARISRLAGAGNVTSAVIRAPLEETLVICSYAILFVILLVFVIVVVVFVESAATSVLRLSAFLFTRRSWVAFSGSELRIVLFLDRSFRLRFASRRTSGDVGRLRPRLRPRRTSSVFPIRSLSHGLVTSHVGPEWFGPRLGEVVLVAVVVVVVEYRIIFTKSSG